MNILPIVLSIGILLMSSTAISANAPTGVNAAATVDAAPDASSAAGASAAPDTAAIEQAVMVVLDDFMTSFSGRDPIAHAATYHFPHFRLAGGVMHSWATAEDAIRDHEALFKNLPATGWHKSIWLDRQITTLSDTKVHVNTRFQRLRADGTEIGAYNSLYVLIKQDGRWGIKMRSSFL